ncbi:(2Fe-2S)-binding protein [Candidatus Aerophobetes bacterium Ae_b3a]|nr:MAG: (2Fe-2S)-binding protein [Candidatus Aerophobetes bacterium Ae_b3a]
MIKLTIDNREVEAREGATILEAARKVGIEIPTLCYHQALTAYGACRVCTVEIIRKEWSRLSTACTYPVQKGIEVKTNSEKVKRARKMILEMLLARCPNVKKIKDLARDMGIEKPRFELDNEECILCGLCVRVCEEIVGVSAIAFFNRGTEREVNTPYEINSDVCLGCGACAVVCPTEAIKAEDIKEIRKIPLWHTELKKRKCRLCGEFFAPEVEIDFLKKKDARLGEEIFETCPSCRKKELGNKILYTNSRRRKYV